MVDVIQAVGRVMRKAEGKRLGYVILPVGIPAGLAPEEVLNDNKRFKVVWQVLNALRSHDERLNAVVNKLDLNDVPPDMVDIQVVGGATDEDDTQGAAAPERERQAAVQLPDRRAARRDLCAARKKGGNAPLLGRLGDEHRRDRGAPRGTDPIAAR